MTSTRIVEHIGRVLDGRYRLLTPIGSGASAHVFLADDVRLRRRVAVKVLHPALVDDKAFLRRFRAEARAAAGLNHPNIMSVFDWGEEADGPYIVCEFLGGGSLRAILDQGNRLTPSQGLMVGLEAARALDYAHRRGIVHRDIKPANILFDDEGRLRIADFGLARALAEAAWTEPSGTVLGTARYAAPEQVQGSPLDGKADVYSLAVVLVEAVTGRVPFEADTTVGTLMGRLDRPLPAPPEMGPLGPIVARAGRPNTAERLDAVALGAALQAAAPELPGPEPLPLAGTPAADEALVGIDPDPTEVGATAAAETAADTGDEAATATLAGSIALPPATETGWSVDSPTATIPIVPSPPPPVATAPVPVATPPPLSKAGRRRRRWPFYLLLAILLIAGAGTGGYFFVLDHTPSHPVPAVQLQMAPEAVAALKAQKFKVRLTEIFFDGTAAGTVVDQTPEPGTKLKEGKTVTLTVSKGPTPVLVPDLTGVSQEIAVERLKGAGFVVAEPTLQNDEEVTEGTVLDWAPKGVEFPKGGQIALTVSAGPAPREVPDVAGKSFQEASAALEAVGLKAARADAFSDGVAEGTTISSSPKGGAQVDRGSTVTVTVSKGQPVVPSLGGLTEGEAKAKLEAVGLKVGGVYGPSGGKVFLTTPGAGTKVKSGSSVGLFIL
ncbi:MAG TPA: PASTA domain-containing protein [Acidimicrobiales bacterium]|nr:PASTA domain-containing protein [Acidimicrobiales bacterium]